MGNGDFVATTINQAFSEYRTNLEIKDRQVSLVSTRRNNAVAAIAKKLSLYPNTPSKLIGSYDRHTLTRYLSEGDVDVMVILHYGNNEGWDNADGTIKALDHFKSILDAAFPNTYKRRDRNCISMQYSEFRLDMVPAFSVNVGGYVSHYKIPDSIRRQWVRTNPFTFAEKITQVNSDMGKSFVPLIKMVKGWNREVGGPISSFHLECMMYNRYSSYTQGYTYPSMLKVFFENLPGYLSQPVYDPVMGDRVDTYLDNSALKTKRQIAIEKAQSASAAATEAFEDQERYPAVAIDEWKALLGEFFPSYG
jgi:hypothetical protein